VRRNIFQTLCALSGKVGPKYQKETRRKLRNINFISSENLGFVANLKYARSNIWAFNNYFWHSHKYIWIISNIIHIFFKFHLFFTHILGSFYIQISLRLFCFQITINNFIYKYTSTFYYESQGQHACPINFW